MPMMQERLFALLRFLDDEWVRLHDAYYLYAPRNGIPIGGGDWMDTFFKMEGVRGIVESLRMNKPLDESIEMGKTLSEIAVRVWNGQREYQVHRWDKCCHDYLDKLIAKFYLLDERGELPITVDEKDINETRIKKGDSIMMIYTTKCGNCGRRVTLHQHKDNSSKFDLHCKKCGHKTIITRVRGTINAKG